MNLRQPWATLVVTGKKTMELRRPGGKKYSGTVYISEPAPDLKRSRRSLSGGCAPSGHAACGLLAPSLVVAELCHRTRNERKVRTSSYCRRSRRPFCRCVGDAAAPPRRRCALRLWLRFTAFSFTMSSRRMWPEAIAFDCVILEFSTPEFVGALFFCTWHSHGVGLCSPQHTERFVQYSETGSLAQWSSGSR